MNTTTTNITVSGRIDPDSFLDFALAAKARGWDISTGGGYRPPNGSVSLIVIAPIPDGCNESDLVKEIWDVIPKLDGAVLTSAELAELSAFDIDDDSEDEKWW